MSRVCPVNTDLECFLFVVSFLKAWKDESDQISHRNNSIRLCVLYRPSSLTPQLRPDHAPFVNIHIIPVWNCATPTSHDCLATCRMSGGVYFKINLS